MIKYQGTYDGANKDSEIIFKISSRLTNYIKI